MSAHIIYTSHKFPNAALDAAAVVGRIVGPVGRRGRVTSLTVLCTVDLTGSVGAVNVGNAGAAAAYMSLTLPNTTAPARVDGTLSITYDRGGYQRSNPDEVIEIAAGGEPSAGDGDITVTAEWA